MATKTSWPLTKIYLNRCLNNQKVFAGGRIFSMMIIVRQIYNKIHNKMILLLKNREINLLHNMKIIKMIIILFRLKDLSKEF